MRSVRIARKMRMEDVARQVGLKQLQNLYEAISGYALNKRNFNRKILDRGLLVQLKEKETASSKGGRFTTVLILRN